MARTIVVTGGGTGICRACTALFLAQGDQVFVTGRRRAVLEAAAAAIGGRVGEQCRRHTDLSEPAAQGGAVTEEGDRLADVAERWRAN